MKILSPEHSAPVFKYQGVNAIKHIQFINRNCEVIDFFWNCKWSFNIGIKVMDSLQSLPMFVVKLEYTQNLGKYGHLLLDWRGAPILVHARWTLALTVVPNELRLSHYLFSNSKTARVGGD